MPAIDVQTRPVAQPAQLLSHACDIADSEHGAFFCPFRATCKSPICKGDWSKPDCPGSRRSKLKGH